MTLFQSLTNNKCVLILVVLCTSVVSVFCQDTPRSYVANKAVSDFVIDGKPNEVSWKKAAWSDLYIDIEGKKRPTYDTRMKMTYDDQNLYILAEMSEPHIWATLKQRDTIIFYNNDFEIFIDPDGDTHNYYEFEMNALNTIWDLFLTKPYRNHGKVLGDWDFKGLKSAVHIQGTLNNASDIDTGWSVEVAIPWSFVTEPGGTTKVPMNEYWRMNFSRVNWDFDLDNGKYYRKKDSTKNKFLPENNWVWSPQEVINMHEPERWGYVYFSEAEVGNETVFEIPKDEHIKWYLYALYREYSKLKENNKVEQKKEILDQVISPKLFQHEFGWVIWAISPFTNNKISIKQDGKIEVSRVD
jgi:hypothetical protein